MVWIQTAWQIYLDLYILLLPNQDEFMFKLPYGSLIYYTGTGSDFYCSNQGRCPVFESGPADETTECRKIETWESTKRPLSLVAFVRPPRRKKNLDRLFVCFKCFLCWVWDHISIFFGHELSLKNARTSLCIRSGLEITQLLQRPSAAVQSVGKDHFLVGKGFSRTAFFIRICLFGLVIFFIKLIFYLRIEAYLFTPVRQRRSL